MTERSEPGAMGEPQRRARLIAIVVLAAVVFAAGLLAPIVGEPLGAPRATATPPPAKAAAVPPPKVKKKLIPYPQSRKNHMAAYSQRHYGESEWRLTAPKLIVIHYAQAGTVGSIYNTFAPDRPDVEYKELPGVCSHFAVSAKGIAFKLVPVRIRCRHVVGLNHVSIGIEHVGFSDAEVLRRKPELKGSLRLTHALRCRFGIPIKGVIGHAESLSSPFYRELDPDFQGRTHSDFKRRSMRVYRRQLARLGAC